MKKCVLIYCLFVIALPWCVAQTALIEGYVFEDGTQNYLSSVNLEIYDDSTGLILDQVVSESDGYFSLEVDKNSGFRIIADKAYFKGEILNFSTQSEEKVFIRLGMKRQEGYLLTVNIARPRDSINASLQRIYGAGLSIYNNTLDSQEVSIDRLTSTRFVTSLVKKNHYTILIEKEDYLTKRIEAFVNVAGCVLCFEGIDKVRLLPNDSIKQGLSMGFLSADVDLIPVFKGEMEKSNF